MFSFVNLWELSDHTLFDNISLPDGIDKEILVNTIFDEVSEFEPLTIDVDMMKAKINVFFKRNYDNFARLYKYTTLEYDPIENYNKYSEINTTNNRSTNGSDETTNKISSYDSTDFQNNSKETATTKSSNDDKGTIIEHTHGNIGVTTSTQMLEQDTNYWSKNNLYMIIAEKFMFTFCIVTY